MPISNHDPEIHSHTGKTKGVKYLKNPRPLSDELAAKRDAIRKSPRGEMQVHDTGDVRAVDESAQWKTLAPEQLEAKYQHILSLKARVRTDQAVADAMRWTLEGLRILLSEHKDLHQRYHDLRKQMAQAQKHESRISAETPTGTGDFLWTETSRTRLLDHYVNTGSLFAAQKEAGCTPTQFNTEVANNASFSHAYKVARKAARATLRILAEDKAINGDERLLAQLLKEGEEEGATQLTDSQIEHRILGILASVRNRLDPLGTSTADPGREAGVDDDADGGGEASEPEQVLDDLS